MTANKLLPIIAVIAAVAIAFFAGRCGRDGGDIDVVTIPAEADRQRVVATDTTERAKYRKLAADRLTQIEALRSDLKTAEGKRKAAEQKAAESAAEYAKTPTLANCHTALTDCQEGNETKAYSLAVQERMLNEADSLDRIRVSEIDRRGLVIDTLAEGWKQANVNNARLSEEVQKEKGKVKKRNTLLKIGGGIIAALAGVIAIR